MPEIITGDMPTPVKHGNPELQAAYKAVENDAAGTILSMLPEYMRESYLCCFAPRPEDRELQRLVKAADKISALIKCVEEEQAGNREFLGAKQATLAAVREMDIAAADRFVDEFLQSYSLNLDELLKN